MASAPLLRIPLHTLGLQVSYPNEPDPVDVTSSAAPLKPTPYRFWVPGRPPIESPSYPLARLSSA